MPIRPLRLAAVLHLENNHGHGILRGIAQFCRSRPQIHVLKFAKTALLSELSLREINVDGIIVKIVDPDEAALLRRLRLPAINISGEISTPRLPTINTDDRLVGVLGAQLYQRRGYRHLAYCGNVRHRASVLRGDGFIGEAQRHGLTVHRYAAPQERELALRSEQARRAMAHWLQRLPRPVGLMTFSDLVANEVASACELAGLRVPDDVAILGVGNDVTRLDFSMVPLSSIELNTHLIGFRAAELLFNQLTRGVAPPREELIKPLKIVTRRSTDHFAVDDEIVTFALDHIRENIGNTLYVDDIARAAGTSRRTLELRFRRALGNSVYAEVQQQRLERVRDLLSTSRLSVGEIAYSTGHENARHLTLAFKRRFGTTPGRHRLQNTALPAAT